MSFDRDNIEEILSDIGIEVVSFPEIVLMEEIGHGGFGKVYKA